MPQSNDGSEGLLTDFEFSAALNYGQFLQVLAKMAAKEDWSYRKEPGQESRFGILSNYLKHTYTKILEDKLVVEKDGWKYWHTGLYTSEYDDIIFTVNQDGFVIPPQKLSELKYIDPKRINFFSDTTLLIFNPKYEIRCDINHIINENDTRLPDSFNIKNITEKKALLAYAIEQAKKNIQSNYTLAVPMYYKRHIQLLIPIILTDESAKPDFALVIEEDKSNKVYQGHTCLTLDMAYNNARLITKPSQPWIYRK